MLRIDKVMPWLWCTTFFWDTM